MLVMVFHVPRLFTAFYDYFTHFQPEPIKYVMQEKASGKQPGPPQAELSFHMHSKWDSNIRHLMIWMTGVLRTFQQYFVISGQLRGKHEGLCAMKGCLSSERNSPQAEFEPETRDQNAGVLTARAKQTHLLIRWLNNWAKPWENVSVIGKQQRCRSACASAQSDQRVCFSLLR